MTCRFMHRRPHSAQLPPACLRRHNLKLRSRFASCYELRVHFLPSAGRIVHYSVPLYTFGLPWRLHVSVALEESTYNERNGTVDDDSNDVTSLARPRHHHSAVSHVTSAGGRAEAIRRHSKAAIIVAQVASRSTRVRSNSAWERR